MRRTAIAAILACAMLLAASIVSPAFGGPSIGSVAKTAKKALKTGKSAERTARSAKRTSNAANGLAATANGKADQALARPVLNAAEISTAHSPVNFAPPGGVSSAIAFCPAGQRVISGGGFFNTGAPDGLLSTRANHDRSAWFVIGLSSSSITGTIEAYAYCAPVGGAVAAGVNRARTRAEVARTVEQVERLQ
jgi:hypothetical protein